MRSERRLPRRAVRRNIAIAVVALTASAATFLPPLAGADELSDKRAQAQEVGARLDGLQSRVQELDAQAERAKGDLAEAEAAVADAQRRADEANAELDVRRQQLQRFSVDAYVNGNEAPGVDTLLVSDSDDAPKVQGYLSITSGNRHDLIDQLQATKQKAEEEGAQLESAKAELDAKNQELQASLDEAQQAVDEQESIKSQLDGEIATLVAQEQARKEAEARAAAEARAQAQLASAPQANAPAPSRSRSGGSSSPAPVDDGGGRGGYVPPPGGGASVAVDAAMSRLGSPYVWGAGGPDTFDCSGLTMWAWAQAGVSLSHYTGSQLAETTRISAGEAQPGDLVFFWSPGSSGDPGHVGLYIGGGQMVHAPNSRSVVRVESVGYWPGARVAYGRVTG